MKIVAITILIISNVVCLGQNEGLSVTDFKFDGPLGCEGVKIEKWLKKNHKKKPK